MMLVAATRIAIVGPLWIRCRTVRVPARYRADTRPPETRRPGVGIEPTTNGLRVQVTRAGAGRKPKNRNVSFTGARAAAPRPNLCRTSGPLLAARAYQFRCASTSYRCARRTVPRTGAESALRVNSKREYRENCAMKFGACFRTRSRRLRRSNPAIEIE